MAVEIEDMEEPFCGCRRKSITPLIDGRPDVAEDWAYDLNAGWGPEHVGKCSAVKAWWYCRQCSRPYKALVCNRTSNESGCHYCTSKKVCEDNSLAVLYPELAKEWHPIKNKNQKFEQIIKMSSKRAWWLCSKCGHDWDCAISSRTLKDSGCPACYKARMEYAKLHPKRSERKQVIFDENSELTIWYQIKAHQNFVSLSKYSEVLAAQWHPIKNGRVMPDQISKGSDAIAWWKCKNGRDHEWQAPIYSRTTKNKTSGCPCCSGKKLSITNCLATVNPELAQEWHPFKNQDLTPTDVIANGNTKYWWQCKDNPEHIWQEAMNQRMAGRRCQQCKKKARTERFLARLTETTERLMFTLIAFTQALDTSR